MNSLDSFSMVEEILKHVKTNLGIEIRACAYTLCGKHCKKQNISIHSWFSSIYQMCNEKSKTYSLRREGNKLYPVTLIKSNFIYFDREEMNESII